MSFSTVLEQKIMPVAAAIGNQRHLRAIRCGIIATMPLTIVGSFFTILLNLPIDSLAAMIEPYRAILDIPFRFTVGILALYATFGISSSLAKDYDLDSLTAGLIAVLAFMIISAPPIQVTEDVEGVISAGRYINLSNLGSGSLFGAIVTSLATVEIYNFFLKHKAVIKMPDGVPPEVANSFIALLPGAVVLLVFWVLRYMLGFDLNAALSFLLTPLKGLLTGNSLFGGLLCVFLIGAFWSLGIHGETIMGPVIRPFWDMAIAENMDAFAAGTPVDQLPNIFTEQFQIAFLQIGGTGVTLALVVLFLFSRSRYLKSLGRLSFVPAIFNISEPIVFGAPIVLNPILGIPFVIAPLVCTVIGYVATITGFVPMMMAKLPFTIPTILGAVISTNWAWSAAVIVVINFFVAMAIYYPFFKVYEKQQIALEKQQDEEDAANAEVSAA